MGPKAESSSSSPPDSNAPTSSFGDITISELPLALPDRDTPLPPGHRTLLDLIDEKRPRDSRGNAIVPTQRRKPDRDVGGKKGAERDEGAPEEDEDEAVEMEDLVGPLAMAFFYTVPLTLTLAAFEVVVHQQYRQDMEWSTIGIKCLKAFPIFLALTYTSHPHRLHPILQFAFFLTSITCGCWIIHAVNKFGYYAVMKRAPPVGTLWVWAALEMELVWLVASCVLVSAWTWWGNYAVV